MVISLGHLHYGVKHHNALNIDLAYNPWVPDKCSALSGRTESLTFNNDDITYWALAFASATVLVVVAWMQRSGVEE
ncbi:MAG: hypothetical protein WD709_00835 [Gammaproteobacteria bacterium]